MPRAATPIDLQYIKRHKFHDRFWARVAKTPGCWEWNGQRNQRGYGQIEAMIKGRRYAWLAHRVVWVMKRGEIPADRVIMHSCDNPSCCNIKHLQLGTHQQNMAEAVQRNRMRGAMAGRTGAKHPRSRYTQEQRDEAVRLRFGSGMGQAEIAQVIGCERTSVSRWIAEHVAAKAR
jgi:hypothetical protein